MLTNFLKQKYNPCRVNGAMTNNTSNDIYKHNDIN